MAETGRTPTRRRVLPRAEDAPSDSRPVASSSPRGVRSNAEADGTWGEKSRAALRDFARHAKLSIDDDEPSISLFDATAAAKSRVCPLQCADDEVMSDGRCVAMERPPRRRREEEGTHHRVVRPACSRRRPPPIRSRWRALTIRVRTSDAGLRDQDPHERPIPLALDEGFKAACLTAERTARPARRSALPPQSCQYTGPTRALRSKASCQTPFPAIKDTDKNRSFARGQL
jgi:hypothetical protein